MAAPSDPTAVFDDWLSAARHAPRPVSDDSAAPIRNVWLMWCRFLAGRDRGRRWDLATAEDVHVFLKTLPAQQARTRPALQAASAVTRYRYARLLERLYGHAQILLWMDYNPVADLHRRDRPAWPEQSGTVLLPALWQVLPEFFPVPEGSMTTDASDHALACRDRAISGLLYHLALTPQEVRELRPEHVQLEVRVPHLLIEGERDAANRRLELSDHQELRWDLAGWLRWRRAAEVFSREGLLFTSRRGQALAKKTLYNLVAKVVQEACDECELPMPARIGPQTIRNTAIASWLARGDEQDAIMKRAGLRDPRVLSALAGRMPTAAADAGQDEI